MPRGRKKKKKVEEVDLLEQFKRGPEGTDTEEEGEVAPVKRRGQPKTTVERPRKTKVVEEDIKKVMFALSRDAHRRVKLEGFRHDQTMSEVVEELILANLSGE